MFEFDPRAGELRKQGIKIKIQGQPVDILAVLLEHAGDVVTREELRAKLWPADTFVDFEHSLNAAVNKLREALGDSADNPRFIETLPRRGYRFITQVDGLGARVPMSDARVTTDSFTRRVGSPLVDAAMDAHHSRTWWRGKTGLGIASLVLAALLALGTWFAVFRARGEAIDSVAVLPFVNVSADPNTEYLSDGITESLINNLAQLPNLRVMARSTMFRYKGKEADPQKVGQDLRVRAVLSGRLVQRGDIVAVQAELVDVANGSQLWGGQYNRKAMDVFALQEDLSKEISGKLRLRLTGEEKQRLTKRYTENTEAYQLYLKGRYFWNKWTPEGFHKATEYFQQAIEKDPAYALAHIGLADTYTSLAYVGELPPREAVPKAKAAALKALEIDSRLAEAHVSLGFASFTYDWDWLAAGKHFERALALNPAYPIAHQWYPFYLDALGQSDQALAEGKRGLDLDPASPAMSQAMALHLYYGRRFDEAIEQFRKTAEMDPSHPVAYMGLGLAYAAKGMYREALPEFEKYSELDRGRPRSMALLA
jgi:TolB-like protein/DNA-binding winged helix-turn-helix (wHTH) protein/Tfp pilus assembly protein PilF